jgi:5-oxoprolinase (ATP-hydrolysing)
MSWEFWIDRGGTFTDVIGLSPEGQLHVRKVLSRNAAGEADPGLKGAAEILAAAGSTGPVKALKVGTTVATNALLERKGEPVLLVTTQGHADALRIGYQNRPDIFARHIVLPEKLHAAVVEAHERIDVAGQVLLPLNQERLRTDLQRHRADGFKAVAIVFLHGWLHGEHEQQAANVARELGFEEVSVSHELSPLVRFIARGDTTVLNAYLALPLRRYVEGLQRELTRLSPQSRLELMQSNGGLATAERFRAASSVLSGPAGGLIGMAWAAARAGFTRLIGFDMGGTSTDVSLLEGSIPRRFEHLIAGVRLMQPMLDVHTIAAGGGSIVSYADGRFKVGPASAGADPGPAAYGRGGPLTLTDLQVALGRLRPDTLPHVFGPAGTASIDVEAARQQLAALAAQALDATQQQPEILAESFIEVGVESMANAIRQVATRQGRDAAEFTLFCFGGAGGQYACRVAEACGMKSVLIHPLASVLSAFGIGVADRLAVRRASLRLPFSETALGEAGTRLSQLEEEARTELAAYGQQEAIRVEHALELRAGESEATLSVPAGTTEEVLAAFQAVHRKRFGFAAVGLHVVIEAVRVEARLPSVDASCLTLPVGEIQHELPATAPVWFGQWLSVPLLTISAIHEEVEGPALIVEPHSTIVLERGWRAHRLKDGELVLKTKETAQAERRATAAEPARIEIFNNLFMHIAEQMGEVLKATAQSVNIKERLDYSCALFDSQGGLVANAPHMPVHLGSMGASVQAVIEAEGRFMRDGDSWLLNSPYHGGTHLPDVTVVTPVFLSQRGAGPGAKPDFYVASRAHHADIGGVTPGSMYPFSTTIGDEGVLFESFHLVAAGELREEPLRQALRTASYPARRPDQNLADVRAQLAANARGIEELERAVARHGLATVHDFMRHVQENATACMREAIQRLTPGSFSYELDSGLSIQVRVEIDHASARARIDFTGTSQQDHHNFNAPRAVCMAAVLYVFRTLIERPIPLNEGCLAPLEVIVPPRSLLDPRPPAAVAAGNVETSQCIVDALYGALGVLAASQGTMNNLTFGDERLQYYETIAGGAGAGPGFDGCPAVQTHMTNSRLTDPEILEARFPVLLREFAIRRGSGGRGQYRGGDGVIRKLEFRAPLSGALLANHRRIAPFGLAGGEPGAPGEGYLARADGRVERLAATASFTVEPGDTLTIVSPGGGGYGSPH